MSKHISKSTNPYRMAHDRVRAERGRPETYLCACGCGEQAKHWALKADTVAEPQVDRNEGKAMWFSPLTVDYQPMTVACHKRHDLALDRTQRGEQEFEDHGDGYLGWAQGSLDGAEAWA